MKFLDLSKNDIANSSTLLMITNKRVKAFVYPAPNSMDTTCQEAAFSLMYVIQVRTVPKSNEAVLIVSDNPPSGRGLFLDGQADSATLTAGLPGL